MRLTSNYLGYEHHVTIPRHDPLRVGTLSNILDNVANYLGMDPRDLQQELL